MSDPGLTMHDAHLTLALCLPLSAVAAPDPASGSSIEHPASVGWVDGSQTRYAEDEIRIGTQIEEVLPLRWRRDSGEIAGPAQEIGDDLEMEVGRPTTVLVHITDPSNGFTRCQLTPCIELSE